MVDAGLLVAVAGIHATICRESRWCHWSIQSAWPRSSPGRGAFISFSREATFSFNEACWRVWESDGSFSVGSGAATLQMAQSFGPHVSFGVAGKYVLDNLGPLQHGGGFTFDGGVSMRYGAVGFGFAGQNVGGTMRYGATTYSFPTNYGGGVSYSHAASGLTVACDVNVPGTSYTNVRTGVEWRYRQRVALRAGYRAELSAPADEPLAGPTFGTGLGGHGMWLDYGFVLGGNQGGQHRLAISLRPGDLGWKSVDPFGQNAMPKDFDAKKVVGPPAPSTGDAKPSKR